MGSTLNVQKPEPGDLIEIYRGSYQHWALYVGGGFVIHLARDTEVRASGTDSIISLLRKTAYVKKERLRDVVGNDSWRINNSLDAEYQPLSVGVIVKEALAREGEKLPYSVFTRNCEHFVTELRYGKRRSRQVEVAVQVVGPCIATGVPLGMQAGIWVGIKYGQMGGLVGGVAGVMVGCVVGAVVGGLLVALFGGHRKQKIKVVWTPSESKGFPFLFSFLAKQPIY